MSEAIGITIESNDILVFRVYSSTRVSHHRSGIFLIDYKPNDIWIPYASAVRLMECFEIDNADLEFFGRNNLRWTKEGSSLYIPLSRVSVCEDTKIALAERFGITYNSTDS